MHARRASLRATEAASHGENQIEAAASGWHNPGHWRCGQTKSAAMQRGGEPARMPRASGGVSGRALEGMKGTARAVQARQHRREVEPNSFV
eukprot:799318-Rhodomonas_salina.1